jgi:hypothetical protein
LLNDSLFIGISVAVGIVDDSLSNIYQLTDMSSPSPTSIFLGVDWGD